MDATFWALVALVIFFGLIFWLKVPAQMAAGLDKRSDKIRSELEEARRLREEAQELLAEYQRRRKAAEAEASEIVSHAKHEAKLIAKEAAEKTEEFVARRTALAEQKIAQAESQAISEVKARAVDLAVDAAQKIMADKAKGPLAGELIAKSIAEVKTRLQ